MHNINNVLLKARYSAAVKSTVGISANEVKQSKQGAATITAAPR